MTPEQEHDRKHSAASESSAAWSWSHCPPKEQLAIRYYYLQGLPLRETGRRLDLTRKATRLLIGRAL